MDERISSLHKELITGQMGWVEESARLVIGCASANSILVVSNFYISILQG